MLYKNVTSCHQVSSSVTKCHHILLELHIFHKSDSFTHTKNVGAIPTYANISHRIFNPIKKQFFEIVLAIFSTWQHVALQHSHTSITGWYHIYCFLACRVSMVVVSLWHWCWYHCTLLPLHPVTLPSYTQTHPRFNLGFLPLPIRSFCQGWYKLIQ